MRASNDSYTVFEYITDKLDLLENCFSQLILFSSGDRNSNNPHYDQLTHCFKSQEEFTQIEKRDFISELKFSLEDIINFFKITFKLLHYLIKELNLQETLKTNTQLEKLAVSIKKTHDHLIDYIHKNEIPETLKQEMTYHIEQLKNLIRDVQILEVETAVAKSEGFSEDLPRNLKSREQLTLLKKITADVDQMIRRMPFIVPDEERSRLIQERFRNQLEMLK